MGADAATVRACLVKAAQEAGPSVMGDACRAYLNGFWEWMRAHLPRMSTDLACRFARREVEELAALAARGGSPGAPPRVPDWLRAEAATDGGKGRPAPRTLGSRPIAGGRGCVSARPAPRVSAEPAADAGRREVRATQGVLFRRMTRQEEDIWRW